MSLKRRAGLVVLFSLTSLLSLMMAVGAITSYAFDDQVLPRTIVGGVDVSNLPYQQAKLAIEARATELAGTKLTLQLEEKSANVTLNELGVAVSAEGAISQTIIHVGPLDWAKPAFWSRVFKPKKIGFSYQADDVQLKTKVEEVLGITTAAKNAEIVVEDNQLLVKPSENGVSIDIAALGQAINSSLEAGGGSVAKLAYTESQPTVSTEEATQTKTELEQRLLPVSLLFEDQRFTIAPTAQYSFFSFSSESGQISWQLSESKIRDHLNATVAKKINLKMVQKTIRSDTGEIAQEGRDGREIELAAVTKEVSRTITERISTTDTPILIAAKSIPFTEKIVHPDYILGLFEGMYIDVNLTKQRLYVIYGRTMAAEYLISSGKRSTPTPIGLFYIKNKFELAQSRLFPGIWMQKWNALAKNPDGSGYEGYGLHRVPCFNASCTITEDYSHLGRPASHGCVRIEDYGADWVYDNAPVGTPVNIHT